MQKVYGIKQHELTVFNNCVMPVFITRLFCYNQPETLLSRSMNIYTTPGAVTITCHKRTMPYLEQEVKALGFDIAETFVTGVKLKATVNECIRLNLNLRCASQVLYSLQSFE